MLKAYLLLQADHGQRLGYYRHCAGVTTVSRDLPEAEHAPAALEMFKIPIIKIKSKITVIRINFFVNFVG